MQRQNAASRTDAVSSVIVRPVVASPPPSPSPSSPPLPIQPSPSLPRHALRSFSHAASATVATLGLAVPSSFPSPCLRDRHFRRLLPPEQRLRHFPGPLPRHRHSRPHHLAASLPRPCAVPWPSCFFLSPGASFSHARAKLLLHHCVWTLPMHMSMPHHQSRCASALPVLSRPRSSLSSSLL